MDKLRETRTEPGLALLSLLFFLFFFLSLYAPVGTLGKSTPSHDSNSPFKGSLTTTPIGYVINIKDTPLIQPQRK